MKKIKILTVALSLAALTACSEPASTVEPINEAGAATETLDYEMEMTVDEYDERAVEYSTDMERIFGALSRTVGAWAGDINNPQLEAEYEAVSSELKTTINSFHRDTDTTVPAERQEVHRLITSANENYVEASDLFYDGVMYYDITRIEEATEIITEGNEEITEATQLIMEGGY